MANRSPISSRSGVIKQNARGAGRSAVAAQKARIGSGARVFGIRKPVPGGAQ